MKYIYYPEYELEYRDLLEKNNPPNHILNIRLLMLLCEHVIIPSGHLLYTDHANILGLISYLKEFFEAGKIVTTNYECGIDSYFASRIDRMTDPVIKRAKEMQAERIKEELLINREAEHSENNQTTQLILFDTRTRELITDFNKHKKQSILILNQMDAVSDRTGQAIHSNQFREILTGMLNNGDIKKPQYNDYMNLMSNAYYDSGTYTMNTLVSYNSYFKKIDLQNSLMRTQANAVNPIIDPYFLQSLFGIMGVDIQDIYKLSVSDYKKIMSCRYWTEFMELFRILYVSAQDLDAFLMQETKSMEIVDKRKSTLFKVLDGCFGCGIMTWLLSIFSLEIQIGIPLVIYILRTFFGTATKVEKTIQLYTTDKIIDRIQQSRDPLYEFCYRLKAAIHKLR